MTVSVVTGGLVLTPGGPVRADLLIRDGTVAALRPPSREPGPALDASGCYVLPGGVDPHAHLMAGIGPATSAAARGGTTTVLSFTSPSPGETDLECLLRSRSELAGRAVIDVGLHACLYDPQRVTPQDLAAARTAGAAAAKIFLAYPELGIMCSTRRLYELMSAAADAGLLMQVHCENGPLIEALAERSGRDGRRGPRGPVGGEPAAGQAPAAGPDQGALLFAATRPPQVEEEAVASALAVSSLAGAACYLVHLSSADTVRQVRLARRGPRPPVIAEACLHHLLLDDRCYAGPDAGRYLVCPPLRDRAHACALWEALADGTIDTVGSDHCQVRSPVTGSLAETAGGHAYGLAGIGPRLPLLLAAAAARGLPLQRVVQLAAENPARAFGHYPRKGALLPGSDADLVIYDPAGETVIGRDGLGDGTGDSVYAGRTVSGRIRDVLLRGRQIVADGVLAAGGAGGVFLPAGGCQPCAGGLDVPSAAR